MKKIKLFNRINLVMVVIGLIVDIVLGFVMKGNKNFYISTCITIILLSIINLVFIMVKEASVMMYDSKKLEPVCHVVNLMLATIGYYVVVHLDGYDNWAWLYWVLLIVLIIANLIFFYILIRRQDKKNKNIKGPRFMVNK